MRLSKTQTYLEITHSLKEYCFKLKNYKLFTGRKDGCGNLVVCCISDKVYAGGLCDRFKGMISAYAWAKANGYGFRILHTTPYDLSVFLKHAAYDWTLKEGELSRGASSTKLFLVRGEKGGRLLKFKPDGRQMHYYGNMDVLARINDVFGKEYKWGDLFKELFKPSEELQALIDEAKPEEEYVSASFRFQKLLGDFDEKYHASINSEEARKELIDKCLAAIERIRSENPGKKVLVTSDSTTFIEAAKHLEGVFTVEGKRVHIQYDTDAAYDDYLTCFIDFYLLTESCRLYRVCFGKMYLTGFPATAALVNGRDLIDITDNGTA